MNYIYTIKTTEGTTGFATCLPDPAPDLAETIRLLAKRPLDTFLHRYALDLLLDASPEQWLELADACVRTLRPHVAALLLELATLREDARRVLASAAPQLEEQPWQEYTPETVLIRPQVNKALRQAWREHIHQHKALPDLPPETEEMVRERERLVRAQGILARCHAQELERHGAPDNVLPNSPDAFLKLVREVLDRNVPVLGQEMRHEASLSPIALLRPWRLLAAVDSGRNAHSLQGDAMAYGRGLKLVQARISCHMEIVERLCAYAHVEDGGQWGRILGHELRRDTWRNLHEFGIAAVAPASVGAIPAGDDFPLHWLPGEDSHGQAVLAPAQAAFLFCNLDEAALFEHIGSTGLASGATMSAARLHALEEVLERYAHATTGFHPENCFEPGSRDPIVHSLLADYRWRGIKVQFQDITTELGVPTYRCFVQGKDGRIAQATGAGLSGARAALSALTETPWPYVWANPVPAPSGGGLSHLPQRIFEDLPDFSFGNEEEDLALLHRALQDAGLNPVYVDISRPDIPFPVCRAFVPGLAIDTELECGPSATLLVRSKIQRI